MSLVRESVYAALANLVFTDPRVTGIFATTGRYAAQIQQASPGELPALYMFQIPEQRKNKGKGIPPERTLRCQFIAYFATENPETTLPATALNNAADAIDDIVSEPANPGNVQTLGGLVEHVYIDPAIDYYEGLLQERSALVATVAMLVP